MTIGALLALGLGFFQNCGPSKVSGSSSYDQSSEAPSSGSDPVGSKLNLAELLASPLEDSKNLIFPKAQRNSTRSYQNSSPIVENLVLRNNSFDQIYWVAGDTGEILGHGASFSQVLFNSSQSRPLYVFGKRQNRFHLIFQTELLSKTAGMSQSLLTDSALKIVSEKIDSNSEDQQNGIETYLISLDFSLTDVKSLDWSVVEDPSFQILDHRAFLFKKPYNEQRTIQVLVQDIYESQKILSLDLSAQVTPPPPTCEFSGVTYALGASVSGFSQNSVNAPVTCASVQVQRLCTATGFPGPLFANCEVIGDNPPPLPTDPLVTFEQSFPANVNSSAGSSLNFSLRFQTTKPLLKDYTVMVHVMKPDRTAIFMNMDHTLPSAEISGVLGTSNWNGSVSYNLPVSLPVSTPAGVYPVRVWLYDYDNLTGTFLPIQIEHQAGVGVVLEGSHYMVGTITVN